MDAALRYEFRKGFYIDRLAEWIEDPVDQSDDVSADVAGCLADIQAGRRDFAYPGHDAAVLRLLQQVVPERALKHGADIGCESGCFPAMQIASGIELCTVFEVRQTEVNHKQVQVRVQDLTYAEDLRPEFDLITCLSTIEHVGLGRYGDPLDPSGDLKMAMNLRQLLRPGGLLLMSFPTGPGCVVFNKHRIYTPHRCAALFSDLVLLQRTPDRSLFRRWRHRAAEFAHRPGTFWQPIYVLEKAPRRHKA